MITRLFIYLLGFRSGARGRMAKRWMHRSRPRVDTTTTPLIVSRVCPTKVDLTQITSRLSCRTSSFSSPDSELVFPPRSPPNFNIYLILYLWSIGISPHFMISLLNSSIMVDRRENKWSIDLQMHYSFLHILYQNPVVNLCFVQWLLFGWLG